MWFRAFIENWVPFIGNFEEIPYLSSISLKERSRYLGIPLYFLPVVGITIKHRYQQEISRLPAVQGMPEILRILNAEGCALGLMTSNSRSVTQDFLDLNEIHLFQSVHYSLSPFSKERSLVAYLKQCRLDFSKIYYVGDELRDMRAGKKAGGSTVAAAWVMIRSNS
ncbi:HAD hydrolase-like protein [Paenibacillus sp. S-38]|uniref:HAD hydrolase-like protein n=1 Tax=Paenibacillus sp. S-38 TaxID=3416710 RepID=UPI003CECF3C7